MSFRLQNLQNNLSRVRETIVGFRGNFFGMFRGQGDGNGGLLSILGERPLLSRVKDWSNFFQGRRQELTRKTFTRSGIPHKTIPNEYQPNQPLSNDAKYSDVAVDKRKDVVLNTNIAIEPPG